jgi:hypothetical protein
MKASDYRRQVREELGSTPEAAPGAVAGTAPPGPELEAEEWPALIAALADGADPGERLNALRLLKAASFGNAGFDACRPAFLAALRKAASEGDEALRRAALDILANHKDDSARALLIEGLRDETKALVPPAVALGLLARDDHGSAIAFARRFLESDSGRHVKEQAVRLLAADPGSHDLLARLMRDKEQFREVRRASAVALRGLNPDAFVAHARDILADGSDFKEIRATLRGAFERAGIAIPHPAPAGAGTGAPAARGLFGRLIDWLTGRGRSR